MNIKLIKAELEKLSFMLSAWESEESVSAIERDIALDKLKTLYDLVRFDTTPQPTDTVAPIPAVQAEPMEETTENEENDVEVELIFAEDDDMFTLPSTEESEEDAVEDTESPISLASEILTAAIGASATEDSASAAQQTEPTIAEPQIEKTDKQAEKECAPAIEPAPESEPEEVKPEPTPVVEPTPDPEPEPAVEPAVEPKSVAEKSVEREEPRTLNSLFGMEEVQRRPRTKHQRMMSIYSDSEVHQEKVVDISKIFDMEIDAPIPMTSKITEFTPEPEPEPTHIKPVAAATTVEPEAERPKTLADAISPSTPTLADTLAVPTPLGEEILNSRIVSLRDGIGLNDKFLMIRDLFDGDDEAYDEAISALDRLETMDDCMIHIIENYAWNPDSEGSKFIMQLLERKLS